MAADQAVAGVDRYTTAVLALSAHVKAVVSVPQAGGEAVDWWLVLADRWRDVALYADCPFANDRAHAAAETAERYAARLADADPVRSPWDDHEQYHEYGHGQDRSEENGR